MASHRQHKLDRILDLSGPGTYNEETGRWSQARPSSGMGDRQSDALARQIAMAPILNANAALLATTFADSSAFKSPSGTPSSNPVRRGGITDEDTKDSDPGFVQRMQAANEREKIKLQYLLAHPQPLPEVPVDRIDSLIADKGKHEGWPVFVSTRRYADYKDRAAKGDEQASRALSILDPYVRNKQLQITDKNLVGWKYRYPIG